MASLKDIAEELEVSVSLVSKVLNDRLGTTGARKELIESIRNKAAELGYQRNHNALSLLSKRQNAIAVFLHRHGAKGTVFTEELLEGIANTARLKHQRMILNFFTEANEFHEKISELHTGLVDGIILSGVIHKELIPQLLELRDRGLKLVSVYNDPAHPDIPNIGLGDHELNYLGAKHLIQQGCHRIVHFDTIPKRTQGFRDAMKDAKIEVDERLVVSLPHTKDGFSSKVAGEVTARLLDDGIEFDGICAQSDNQGFGAINELSRRGICVPEDVKIIGVDDSPFCELSVVHLSSVSQNYYERGQLAVELLTRAMEKPDVRSVEVMADLKIRASTIG